MIRSNRKKLTPSNNGVTILNHKKPKSSWESNLASCDSKPLYYHLRHHCCTLCQETKFYWKLFYSWNMKLECPWLRRVSEVSNYLLKTSGTCSELTSLLHQQLTATARLAETREMLPDLRSRGPAPSRPSETSKRTFGRRDSASRARLTSRSKWSSTRGTNRYRLWPVQMSFQSTLVFWLWTIFSFIKCLNLGHRSREV